jgi:hypothetical protein
VIELQNEAALLQRSVQRTDQTPDQYYADATRIVQIKTALHRRIEPASVDADAASTIFNLDESERVRLRELFHRNDEVRYSGSANGNRTVPEQTRHEITALLNRLS